MTTNENPYLAGYEAAYAEIYRVLADEKHVGSCGECRPCGVAKQAVETLMECLAGRMSADDFLDLACILARSNTTLIDAEGHVVIDWWGEFADVAGHGGTYEWRDEDDQGG